MESEGDSEHGIVVADPSYDDSDFSYDRQWALTLLPALVMILPGREQAGFDYIGVRLSVTGTLDALDAARAGVCVHASAGDMAATEGERGLMASDLLPYIRLADNPSSTRN